MSSKSGWIREGKEVNRAVKEDMSDYKKMAEHWVDMNDQ